MTRRLRWCAASVCLCVLAGRAAPLLAAAQAGPSKLELSGAEHRIRKAEDKVRRMRGQTFPLGHTESEALKRVAALHEKHPDHPKVKELFERARKILLASKGKTVETKPHWGRFRENGKRLVQLFAAEGDKAYEAFRAKALATKDPITKAFPPPDSREARVDKMLGRTVILPQFQYPDNEFTALGGQYCFVGSGARGYYYVELSNRDWLGAYEAVRRYRRELGVEVPQEVKWTIVGKIAGLHLLVPQAGKKKTRSAHYGWLVQPQGIYIPGHTFAAAMPELELGGRFAAEERIEEVKAPLYTVRSIPDDVAPERLVEIFATAIMEKNHKLYLECIDPARRKTPRGLSRIDYHWEHHQRRFATFYVRIKVEKATIRVLKGFDTGNSIETIFLTKEDREKIKKTSEPLVEEAEVKTRAYDERGRQYGSPKPHFLKRVAKARWYITNYPQPF